MVCRSPALNLIRDTALSVSAERGAIYAFKNKRISASYPLGAFTLKDQVITNSATVSPSAFTPEE